MAGRVVMPGTHPTLAKRRRHREETQQAQRIAAEARAFRLLEPFVQLVNGMTNWQRSRWAQAGYPGLWAHEIAAAEPFSRMRRPA